ncbi:hypothetical protein ACSDR0_42165 [Streptosporangium sp. G11]|uniref:hypothetical protein n=1 Tax=Streptosporangium sp. G11 TaxID=3436926 RepID=UPI003EB6D4AA
MRPAEGSLPQSGLIALRTLSSAIVFAVLAPHRDKTGQTVKSAEGLMKLIQMAFLVHGIHPTMPRRHKTSTTS